MPRELTSEQITSYRTKLCSVATHSFAENGYAGVTLRSLARELGCSPMTPYRYFKNKDEIFAAVRERAFERFSERVESVEPDISNPIGRIRAAGREYIRFALDEPHAYSIMFELEQPEGFSSATELRCWQVFRETIQAAITQKQLRGDPDTLAHLFWGGLHGLVSLHLARKLERGRSLDDLVGPMIERILARYSNTVKTKTKRKSA